jgi:hypothetical protein
VSLMLRDCVFGVKAELPGWLARAKDETPGGGSDDSRNRMIAEDRGDGRRRVLWSAGLYLRNAKGATHAVGKCRRHASPER